MKTLEETKKGLEICYHSVVCDECPYRYKPWTEGGRCVDGLQSDALAHIEQLESQIHRWIPVEERLPTTGEALISYCGYTCIAWHHGQGKFETGSRMMLVAGKHSVTHWMPLPEPPEELEDKYEG